MRNYLQPGDTLHYTNATGADIAAGAPVIVGSQIGVAIGDIANGESGPLSMGGVYILPKTAGAAIAQGTAVIFDKSAAAFVPVGTATATGDVTGACTAWEAAASGDTSVAVKINTGAGAVAA